MSGVVRTALFFIAFLLTCAYATARGGKAERQAVLILTGGMLLTWLLIAPLRVRYHQPELGVAFADAVAMAALIWLALTADRFWPLWLAAMQVVVVLSHAAMMLKPFTLPTYYKNTIQLWIYPQLGLLAVATLRHRLGQSPSRMEAFLGRHCPQGFGR